jgi:hypothetical protein
MYRIRTVDNGYQKAEPDFAGTEEEVRRHVQRLWEIAVGQPPLDEDDTGTHKDGVIYAAGFGYVVEATFIPLSQPEPELELDLGGITMATISSTRLGEH